MIVSFSGIDSAGKTTQIELLCAYLDEKRIKYKKIWSKARGTPGIISLKRLLRGDKKMDDAEKAEYRKAVFMSMKKKKLLYTASMLDLCWYWGIYYRILNLTHCFLICDRYIWDTYVELKSDFKGIDIEHSYLFKLVHLIAPKPAISFMFVIPADVSITRDIQKQTAGIDDIEIKKNKISAYMMLKEKNVWTNVIDGMKPIKEIHGSILTVLKL